MNVRIRYNTDTTSGLLISRRNYVTSDGTEVKAELDSTSKRFRILETTTGRELLAGGKTKNLAVLKIQVKDALASMGVQFGSEERERNQLTNE